MRHFAERFRAVFSKPQYQYFVTVLLGLMEALICAFEPVVDTHTHIELPSWYCAKCLWHAARERDFLITTGMKSNRWLRVPDDTTAQGWRWLWVSILFFSIGNIGILAPLGVALPLLVSTVYGQGAWLLGLMSAGGAIGSMLALLLIGQAAKMKRRGLLSYLSMVPTCLGFIIFGLPFPHVAAPVIAPLADVMVGFGIANYNTIWFTIMQEMIPREKLGRVMSLDTLGSFAMAPAAQGLGGILTDSIGPAMVCILGGSLCLVTIVIPLFVREIREMK